MTMRKDAEAQRIAIALLRRGLITVPEATRWAGVSRQLMYQWIVKAKIDTERVREMRVRDWIRAEARNGPRLVEEPAEAADGERGRQYDRYSPTAKRNRGARPKPRRMSPDQRREFEEMDGDDPPIADYPFP